MVKKICAVLKTFADAIDITQGNKRVIINYAVPPIFDLNGHLMASAFDPIFAYHWIDIDVDAEHNEAQISHAEQNTKCKIEELIVKKEKHWLKKLR